MGIYSHQINQNKENKMINSNININQLIYGIVLIYICIFFGIGLLVCKKQ